MEGLHIEMDMGVFTYEMITNLEFALKLKTKQNEWASAWQREGLYSTAKPRATLLIVMAYWRRDCASP